MLQPVVMDDFAHITPSMMQCIYFASSTSQKPNQTTGQQVALSLCIPLSPSAASDDSEDAPEFDAATVACILRYFPGTVFPDRDVCPRPPNSPAVVQDLLEKYDYVRSITYSHDQSHIIPSKSVELEIKRCLIRKFVRSLLST